MAPLTAPFPYAGGKRSWAAVINERLGDVGVYAEPFAGSLAVLLSRPPARREIVCDLDGMICNFWRAVQADPGAVAVWADWPTFHDDLTARHKWLVKWKRDHSARLTEEPEYCDPKAAGWWVWGISLWIGGGFCADRSQPDLRPHVEPGSGGRGVAAQRTYNKRPIVSLTGGGKGASVQRIGVPYAPNPPDFIPKTNSPPGGSGVTGQVPFVRSSGGGQGVQVQVRQRDGIPSFTWGAGGPTASGVCIQRTQVPQSTGTRGERLIPWMAALAGRLEKVIVLRRDWSSAVTPTLLTHTHSGPKLPVGILLDPPYRTEGRSSGLYDSEHQSDDAAGAAYRWAVEHGGTYRIAYCCGEGDWPVPDGWDAASKDYLGVRDAKRRAERKEQIMFSPACRPKAQGGLFT